MNTRCTVCNSLLLDSGFCPTCDQNQLEKTLLHEFGFTKATMPRRDQSSAESRKTGGNSSSATQFLQNPVKRPLNQLTFSLIEDASANSDNYEPDF